MPTLPTITVTQAQADRMLAAYGDVATYKRWLADQIRQYVTQIETSRIRQEADVVAEQTRVALYNELDVPNP